MTRRCIPVILAALCVLGLSSLSRAEGKSGKPAGNANAVELKFDELPAPVQQTITQAAAGNKIEKVGKETQGGQTYYTALYTASGTKMQLEVSLDGKLLANAEAPTPKSGKHGDDDDDEHEHERGHGRHHD